LRITTGRHQTIKDSIARLSEPAIKAIREFSLIAIQMLARYMRMGFPNPGLEPSNHPMNIRKDLHCPLTPAEGQGMDIEILA
jgi:hypothetical protein